MKILYDYQIFLRQKYGGISRYFYELISNLIQSNEILFYAGKYINQYNLEDFRQKCFYYKGNKIPFIPKSKLPNLFLHKKLFKNFLKSISTEIFHLTYYDNTEFETRAKKIITVHDMTHERFPDNFAKLDNSIELKKKAVKNSDGIICISESTKKDLIHYYNVPEEKISVIYHGNSLNYEIKEEAIFKNPYLLYVGDRRVYKNFGTVLLAYKNSDILKRNFSLLCFGGGEFKSKEKSLINEYGLRGKIFQTEGSDRELANAYKYATAFIYPSFYEGFGIPLLEAMHYGCPIVASDASCFPEIAKDAAIYFKPESTEDLISKIAQVINDSELKNELVKKGYEREKQFSWGKCATETLTFYKIIKEL